MSWLFKGLMVAAAIIILPACSEPNESATENPPQELTAAEIEALQLGNQTAAGEPLPTRNNEFEEENSRDSLGKKQGKWVETADNGNTLIAYYVNDTLNGEHRTIQPDGIIHLTHYIHGKKQGVFKKFKENERLPIEYGMYQDDVLIWKVDVNTLNNLYNQLPRVEMRNADSVFVEVRDNQGQIYYEGAYITYKENEDKPVTGIPTGLHRRYLEAGGILMDAHYNDFQFHSYSESGQIEKDKPMPQIQGQVEALIKRQKGK